MTLKGLLVIYILAAVGSISRLKHSSAPTTGTAAAVTRATVSINSISINLTDIPRDSAIPFEILSSRRGLYKKAIHIKQAIVSTIVLKI